MEIDARLARLGLRRGAASVTSSGRRGPAIEELIPAEVVDTGTGAFLRVEETFPLSYAHGTLSLAQLQEQSPLTAARLAGDHRLQDLDLQRAVFLDTETTGLARGTGTYVFLVGIGHFVDGAFRVDQYFMRGLEEERAMLQALGAALDRFQGVISFNGRGFDLPLLRMRFALARMNPRLADLLHFDLLFPARRLWRARLDSCALGSLETKILGIARNSADTPSWQIPSLYSDYLRTGDGRPMTGVLYHNRQDILSLVVLAAHMCSVFSDPWTSPDTCAPDLYSLGRMYESLRLPRRAEQAYRAALDGTLGDEIHDRALRHLSFLLKRQERRSEACDLWWRGVEEGRQLYPYVELAKHYEWQAQDWLRATEVTRRALNHVEASPAGPYRSRLQAELQHRLARLERKIGPAGVAITGSPCRQAGTGT